MAETNHKPVSAFDLFGKSYDAVLKNLKLFAILLLPSLIGALASTFRIDSRQVGHTRWEDINVFNGSLSGYAIVGLIGAGLIVGAIVAVVALFIQAMLTGLQLEAAEGKAPSFNHIFNIGKKYWLKLFGLFLVVGMYLIVPIVLSLGVALILHNIVGISIAIILIVVSVLFVLRHYFLAQYALIDKDLAIFEAMEFSAKISKPYFGYVLSVLGVIILLSLTGVVPFLGSLISFALGSLYSVAPALRYHELKRLSR